jgi:hypothetical protein
VTTAEHAAARSACLEAFNSGSISQDAAAEWLDNIEFRHSVEADIALLGEECDLAELIAEANERWEDAS